MSETLNLVLPKCMIEIGFWMHLYKKIIEDIKLDSSIIKIKCYMIDGDNFIHFDQNSLNNNIVMTNKDTYYFDCALILVNSLNKFENFDIQSRHAKQEPLILDDIIPLEPFNNFQLIIYSDIKKYIFHYKFINYAALSFDNLRINKASSTNTILSNSQSTKLSNIIEMNLHNSHLITLMKFDLTNDEMVCLDSKQIKELHSNNIVILRDFTSIENSISSICINLIHHLLKFSNNKVLFLFIKGPLKNVLNNQHHSLYKFEFQLNNDGHVNKNNQYKIQENKIDLKSFISPEILSSQAVNLNLNLMKWRIAPNLNLDILKNLKCLIIGTGTLGCSIARNLSAWGVLKISLIDNGIVSFSNPVRQNLFNWKQCGFKKVEMAAQTLKQINPSLHIECFDMTIPMPGHYCLSERETIENNAVLLDKLIREHDVVFLVTDTRESRWLPTMLCAYYSKLSITAAIGFDSLVVIRNTNCHQMSTSKDTSSSTATSLSLQLDVVKDNYEKTSKYIPLGCYFCSDVSVPLNSTKDRTFDQQCTVSRPGISNITASLAVELMVNTLQHPDYPYVNHSDSRNDDIIFDTFQSVPQQIRFFMNNWCLMPTICLKFDKCSACSESVINNYKTDRINFILNVVENPHVLSKISGLKHLQEDIHSRMDEVDSDF